LTRLWSCPPPSSPSLASNASWRGVFSPHPPHHHPLPSSLPHLTCCVTQHVYNTTQHNTTKLQHEATATTPYTKRHDTATTRSDTARRRHGLVMMRRRIGHCAHPPKGTFLLLYSTSLTHHLHPQKQAEHARFRVWSLLGTTTTTPSSKTSSLCSFSRVVGSSLLQPTTTTPSILENELVRSFLMVLLFF